VSELWNVQIELRPETDLEDMEALLGNRGATVLTSREAENGRIELLIVIESDYMARLADTLPSGATWRLMGVRGNLS